MFKKRITINDTKNIKHLEFTVPNSNSVYLLVGTNDAGKTTLLICMDRLCNALAFATGFTNTSSWEKADQSIKAVLNELFETEKYDKLMRLKNPNGRGRQATYFYII